MNTSDHMGLRERKIAKAKIAVQAVAFRMFAEQGYAETTVEQIAAAAEISPRTFFRYFHTKEAIVLYDSIDSVVVEAFVAQSPKLTPIMAMRNAIKEAYGGLTPEGQEQELQRFRLLGSMPHLQHKLFARAVFSINLFTELIAEKTQLDINDLRVSNFAGALVGVLVAVIQRAYSQPSIAAIEHEFDIALAHFEKNWRYDF